MTDELADQMTDEVTDEQPWVEVTLTIGDEWKSDPLRVIAGIREGARVLDKYQRKAVKVARQQGRTWDEIGTACGVSRQAAWERFSDS